MAGECVLIVEDAPEVRDMLELYLQDAGYRVFSTESGRECLRLYEAVRPDLVILDIGLPDMDGLTVSAQLRARSAQVGIVLATVRNDDFDRVAGLETGADCYIAKPLNLRVLLAQVRSLLRRCTGSDDEADLYLKLGRLSVDLLRRRIVDDQGCELILTPGEFTVFIGLIEQRGKPVSRSDLLASLRRGQDGEECIDVRTVDTLIARLRRKLELNANRPHLIQTVYGKGYRLADERELARFTASAL